MVRSQDVQQSLMSLQLRQQVQFLQHRMPDLTDKKVSLLVCACGGNEARMRTIAEKMHEKLFRYADVKQAIEKAGYTTEVSASG